MLSFLVLLAFLNPFSAHSTEHASNPAPTQEIKAEEESAHEDLYADQGSIEDPLEGLNRIFFGFHKVIDALFIKPVAVVYKSLIPEPIRKGVSNMLDNLASPLVLVNHMLQGRGDRLSETFIRFVTNSTVGFLGFFDVAHDMGYPGVYTNFGDTLAVWGIGSGPYLYLPILGPSSVRHAAGRVTEWYTDPLNYYIYHKEGRKRRWMVYTRTGIDAISKRADLLDSLDELERNSVDFYAAVRSLYAQSQHARIEKLKAPAKTD